MTRDLGRLAGGGFDLVVIGGGITGAFAAWDAALRGLAVALIERRDFGGATSAASSKLIHGGIRYLQKGEIGKVRESLVERGILMRIAPHLIYRLPFLIPTYGHGMRGKEVLAAAMAVYEAVGAGLNARMRDPEQRIPRFTLLSRSEALALEPGIAADGLTGGVRYDECHMHSSERMTLAVVQAAAAAGAVVANYVEATGFLRTGPRVTGVAARDAATGTGEFEVHGRLVANMTGPWAPLLTRGLGHPAGERYGLAKGCHIITRPLTRSGALAIATSHKREGLSRGGRHFFIIPWRGRSLIGTTNVPYAGNPADVGATAEDIADFVAEVSAAYPAARLVPADVEHAIAGLYPLIDTDVRADVYQGASKVEIHDHQKDGIEGLLTVIGAKYTTARSLAAQAIDRAFRKLGRTPPPSRTAETPVAGGRIERVRAALAEAVRRDAAGPGLGAEVARELVQSYGADYPDVLALVEHDRDDGRRVAPARPTIRAMVRYAAREEMALRLADVVLRRTGLGTIGHPGEDCLRECAAIMAAELGWDARRVEAEIAAARTLFPIRSAG